MRQGRICTCDYLASEEENLILTAHACVRTPPPPRSEPINQGVEDPFLNPSAPLFRLLGSITKGT